MQPDGALERLVERVRDAAARGEPVEIRGGATKSFYGGVPRGAPLDTRDLSGISAYEPTELVITARGGTPLAELERTLAACGQCLPFEPPRFGAGGTVGGMVAAGLSGPARAYAGSVRDHVLGVTLLNGRGELLTFGGQVSKNVAGYDVSRLMAGSLGVLGVICEVSLKVLPLPASSATLRFECDERAALERLGAWAAQPLALSASAWHAGRLYVRVSGAGAAVDAACARLGGARLAPGEAAAWWQGVRDQTAGFFVDGGAEREGRSLWRLSLPPRAPAVELAGEQLIEWHGAERWWLTREPAQAVRAAAAARGGHATRMRGVRDAEPAFAPLSAPLMRVHRALKQAFDPSAIFNPGRLYAGL